VQPQVASFTRACSYDRAGLGLSAAGLRPRTVAAANADLARVLERAAITPPYVLVGHSAGGMYQRSFLASHREQVAGLVLVDTDVPTDDADRQAVAAGDDDRTTGRILTALAYTGVFRLLFRVLELRIGSAESDRYPEEAKVRFSATVARLGAAMPDEWTLYQSAYASMTETSLGDLPLVVIAALGYRPDAADRADWLARQTSLARLSTRSHLVVREDQTHYLPLVEPETVTRAIREVVEASRSPQQ
jgi:pimeloyl-ACP methyl ester carboxylesterase